MDTVSLVEIVALFQLTTGGCCELFPIQFSTLTLLHILHFMTCDICLSLIVQCNPTCFREAENNSTPCSMGHFPERMWNDAALASFTVYLLSCAFQSINCQNKNTLRIIFIQITINFVLILHGFVFWNADSRR